jgi:catechol 2,3-dioxygenase-like lactoylglutathione lyase family enzyme
MKEQIPISPVQQNSTAEQPIAPANLHHIGLRTARFEEMRAFYHIFLDVRPVLEIEGNVGFYTFDGAHHRLVLFEDPACTQVVLNHVGMHHLAFIHSSVDDLMRVYQRLKRQGIFPRFAMDHGPNTALYYQDPDGNLMELQIDNFGPDTRKGLEFFSQFQSHPTLHGKPINPESYLAVWQQGATLAELHEQSFAGAFAEGAAPPPQGFLLRQR